MSPASFHIVQLAASCEPIVEADRRFFARFPDRTYRVRRLARTEVAQLEATSGGPMMPLGADDAAFAVIKQLAPGVRLMIHVPGPADEDGSDVSDEAAAYLWARYAERHPSIVRREAMARSALPRLKGSRRQGGAA